MKRFPVDPRLLHTKLPHYQHPPPDGTLLQLIDLHSRIVITESLLYSTVHCRRFVHSVGLDKWRMTCIQFHCPKNPRPPPVHPSLPRCVQFLCVFRLLQATTVAHSFLAVLSSALLQSPGLGLQTALHLGCLRFPSA